MLYFHILEALISSFQCQMNANRGVDNDENCEQIDRYNERETSGLNTIFLSWKKNQY
jgi:hypothetical protein